MNIGPPFAGRPEDSPSISCSLPYSPPLCMPSSGLTTCSTEPGPAGEEEGLSEEGLSEGGASMLYS